MNKKANKVEEIVEASKKAIESEEFKKQHRTSDKAFSRTRKLIFSLMIVLILQKSAKSLQLRLNEMFGILGEQTVSNSAFTQARANLKHTAFISLNELMVKIFYREGDHKTYQGVRILAVDGSKVRLPEGKEVKKKFGAIRYSNQKEEVSGEHNYAQVSVLFDVLNRMALTAEFDKATAYEVDLAVRHLNHTRKGDIILCDRNYASHYFVEQLSLSEVDFIIRCSQSSFKTAREMHEGKGSDSQVVELKVSKEKSIKVRFVRILLNTGEYEVLVTSLIDEQSYENETFKELYHLRWEIETYYGVLKTRLELENFTGKTVESVLQDFYATVYLTGLESVLTQEANEILKAKTDIKHPQQVNRNVSFHAIKLEVINLLFNDTPIAEILRKLRELFLTNPSLERERPYPARKKRSDRHRLHYHRSQRKHCF